VNRPAGSGSPGQLQRRPRPSPAELRDLVRAGPGPSRRLGRPPAAVLAGRLHRVVPARRAASAAGSRALHRSRLCRARTRAAREGRGPRRIPVPRGHRPAGPRV